MLTARLIVACSADLMQRQLLTVWHHVVPRGPCPWTQQGAAAYAGVRNVHNAFRW